MEKIRGTFQRYLFYNEQNGYSIIRLTNGEIVKGTLPKLNEGDQLELEGNYSINPKYGKQFDIVNYQIFYPTDSSGILKYLSSGLIKGIGEKTAQKIYDELGENTLEILENNFEILLEKNLVPKSKFDEMKESWLQHAEIRQAMVYLQTFGVTSGNAVRVSKFYGKDTINIVNEDPYRLCYEVWGIGFKTADSIAYKLNFGEHHPKRLEAALIYILNEATNDGHVYLTENELFKKVYELININLYDDAIIINNLINQKRIVKKEERVYLAPLFYAERKIEKILYNMANKKEELTDLDLKYIEEIKENFSEEQIEAIIHSLKHNLLVLTGGPGTGKTTTLKGIISIYLRKEKTILLAAPTGRAAKRMTEIIGLPAQTIHRLLGFNPIDYSFIFNEYNKLDADLLIIDEVSMIDTYLMYHLMCAVDPKTTLIFIGDVDQLPSVGAGNILSDLINSGIIYYVKLNKIFRQAETSKIITAAHAVNKGIMPNIFSEKSDFIFIKEEDPTKIVDKIKEISINILSERYNFNLNEHIQILSPMYKTETGVNNLNFVLQDAFNKNDFIIHFGEKKFKLNDKVMQLKNNYEKGVFNGDVGYIQHYNSDSRIVTINFENNFVEYSLEELDEITLAYAVTVHKSQGSEYPCVIMPLTTSHYVMLQRNLLYTAITRAAKLLIIIGEIRALQIAVDNNKIKQRNSSLFKFNMLEEYENIDIN